MEGSAFDEGELFRAIAASGARALLIGRRAMVAYGLPVLTADYDLWLDPDDVEALNAALAPLGLRPTRPPAEFERRIRAPLGDDELEETAALVRWFTRRYPTVTERFAYVRRAWRRWTRPTRLESP